MIKRAPVLCLSMLLLGLGLTARAAEMSAHCELRVGGKTYLDGPCPVAQGPNGSFTMNVAADKKPLTYFAYVDVAVDGSASASWNEDRGSAHAWKSLGSVTHNGDCWTNATTRICTAK